MCWGCEGLGRAMTGEEMYKLGELMIASGVAEEQARGSSLKIAAEEMV